MSSEQPYLGKFSPLTRIGNPVYLHDYCGILLAKHPSKNVLQPVIERFTPQQSTSVRKAMQSGKATVHRIDNAACDCCRIIVVDDDMFMAHRGHANNVEDN